jgi:hypothetical protein
MTMATCVVPQIPEVESVSFQIRLSFVAISHTSMEEWDVEAFMIWWSKKSSLIRF